jgi:hypothetical protein
MSLQERVWPSNTAAATRSAAHGEGKIIPAPRMIAPARVAWLLKEVIKWRQARDEKLD